MPRSFGLSRILSAKFLQAFISVWLFANALDGVVLLFYIFVDAASSGHGDLNHLDSHFRSIFDKTFMHLDGAMHDAVLLLDGIILLLGSGLNEMDLLLVGALESMVPLFDRGLDSKVLLFD